jgi:hypothetical protein
MYFDPSTSAPYSTTLTGMSTTNPLKLTPMNLPKQPSSAKKPP